MAKRDPKESVQQLAAQVGKPKARQFLVAAGVSTSAADKLLRDKYPWEIGLLLGAAIERACESARENVA